jgi:hypothetical protein
MRSGRPFWNEMGEPGYAGPGFGAKVIKGDCEVPPSTWQWRNRSAGSLDLCVLTTPCVTIDQYFTAFHNTLNANSKFYYLLRYTDGATPFYAIVFDTTADTVTWKRMTVDGTVDEVIGAATALTVNAGDWFVATVEGTGNATTVRVWRNPTLSLIYSATDVGGDTTPDVTFTDNPATPVDSGSYVGWGAYGAAAQDVGTDGVEGGDTAIAKAELLTSTFDNDGPLFSCGGKEGTATIVIANGVMRGVYPDAATGFHESTGQNVAKPWDMTGSFVYCRRETNKNNDGQGMIAFNLSSSEIGFSDSEWVCWMHANKFQIVSYDRGASTDRLVSTPIDPNVYRWARWRESGGTLYMDTAPDDAAGIGPGDWTNRWSGTWATYTPTFAMDKVEVKCRFFVSAAQTGDVWFEWDGLNCDRRAARVGGADGNGPWTSLHEWRSLGAGPLGDFQRSAFRSPKG